MGRRSVLALNGIYMRVPSSRLGLLIAALQALCLAVVLAGCAASWRHDGAAQDDLHVTTAGDRTLATIDVSVASIWRRPRLLREVDRPSARNPAEIRHWLRLMTTEERLWLVGRLETQATLGTEVTVLRQSGAWTKVAVHGQSTPRNPEGYPGWMPTR